MCSNYFKRKNFEDKGRTIDAFKLFSMCLMITEFNYTFKSINTTKVPRYKQK